MAALATMAGADALTAEVHLVERGPWLATVRLLTETVPSGAVTLAFDGGLSLVGTIRRAGSDLKGGVVAHVVGGANGLGRNVAEHFDNGFGRDVLGAIARASGETLADDIPSAITTAQFQRYTLGGRCSSALDSLAQACSVATGERVTWRIRPDGKLWMGAETFTAQRLAKSDAVVESYPALGLYEVAVQTPTIAPGFNVDALGNVIAASHYLWPDRVRTWATVRP